jgi:hypothetical protein
MSLKAEKNSIVVLLVEESYYTIKGGFPQIRGGEGNVVVIFRVAGLGVFRRGIQHN